MPKLKPQPQQNYEIKEDWGLALRLNQIEEVNEY
jgi:hypothetical protein